MFLADPLADLEPLGIVERNGHGWQLTPAAQRRLGRELRLFAGCCHELEERGVPREHAVVCVLRGVAERVSAGST